MTTLTLWMFTFAACKKQTDPQPPVSPPEEQAPDTEPADEPPPQPPPPEQPADGDDRDTGAEPQIPEPNDIPNPGPPPVPFGAAAPPTRPV